MHYESPKLEGPFELYDTPQLLDVQKISGAGICITGGGSCGSDGGGGDGDGTSQGGGGGSTYP